MNNEISGWVLELVAAIMGIAISKGKNISMRKMNH